MRLVIATEGSATTGLGHFVRMTALAEAATERGWTVEFVLRPDSLDYAREQVQSSGWHLTLSDWLVGASLVPAGAGEPVVVVVDSYWVDPSSGGWADARSRADLLVAVNDGGPAPADVDVVLNNNLPATAALYPGHGARLLLGTDYTLLRRSFVALREEALARIEALPDEPESILVMLGGTDISGSTSLLAEAAAETFESARIAAISKDLAGQWSGRIEYVAPTPAVAGLMHEADLVISAGGTTIWELGCLAKPAAVLAVADNQMPTYRELVRAGRVIGLGTPPIDAAEARRALAGARGTLPTLGRAMSSLSDGRGADRVLDVIEEMTALEVVTS